MTITQRQTEVKCTVCDRAYLIKEVKWLEKEDSSEYLYVDDVGNLQVATDEIKLEKFECPECGHSFVVENDFDEYDEDYVRDEDDDNPIKGDLIDILHFEEVWAIFRDFDNHIVRVELKYSDEKLEKSFCEKVEKLCYIKPIFCQNNDIRKSFKNYMGVEVENDIPKSKIYSLPLCRICKARVANEHNQTLCGFCYKIAEDCRRDEENERAEIRNMEM